uniref:Uncharacterized protein n=1 Tax=Trichogramma kaykai TaxID=54128 RepID=A0ABD2XCV1_9HYME
MSSTSNCADGTEDDPNHAMLNDINFEVYVEELFEEVPFTQFQEEVTRSHVPAKGRSSRGRKMVTRKSSSHPCNVCGKKFVFSPGVVEPVPEVERVPLKKEDPGYVISLRSGKKTPITVRAGSDRITISRSPRRGLTRLAIDGAQHSHDEVGSENHTHKRASDAGAEAPPARMMAPEARTTLTR